MKKSVYSLVLDDGVVEAVDRLAAEQGSSRSALMNRILAEYFSLATPEKRMRTIFDQLEKMVEREEAFQLQLHPSDAMLSIRSVLHYRYKPTIRYCIELYPQAGAAMGELRVSLRSQSPPLLEALGCFFRLWAALEQEAVAPYLPGGRVRCVIEDGRFTRVLLLPAEGSPSHRQLGRAIAGYVQMLDSLLKLYFYHLEDGEAVRRIQKAYAAYLERGMVLI